MSRRDRVTRVQVVAIQAHFTYRRYRRADRPERLAVCARLLGLNELSSTNDLTPGQAEQLARMLAQLSPSASYRRRPRHRGPSRLSRRLALDATSRGRKTDDREDD